MREQPIKRVDLSKLNPEQRAAFIQLVKDAKQAAPQRQQMNEAANTVFWELLRSPQWGIVDTPPSDGEPAPESKQWHIGAPHINDERPPT